MFPIGAISFDINVIKYFVLTQKKKEKTLFNRASLQQRSKLDYETRHRDNTNIPQLVDTTES